MLVGRGDLDGQLGGEREKPVPVYDEGEARQASTGVGRAGNMTGSGRR
jgi:hypothetical protein